MANRLHRVLVAATLLGGVAQAATTQGPAYVYSGTDPASSCLGYRVWVNETTGKHWCCASGTWTACGRLPSDPAACSAGTFATDQSDTGTLTCAQVGYGQLSGVPATFAPSSHTHPGGEVTSAVASATAASALAADPGDCTPGQYAHTIGTSGALTCSQVAYSQVSGTPTIPADISGAPFVTTAASGLLSAEAVLPTCTSTDKLTFNGTTISCAADQGGTGAPTTAQYWVGAADAALSAEKDLSGFTGLVLNTAGTPSSKGTNTCTNQFPRSDNASGTWTCASIATADLPAIDISKGGTTETASTEDAVLVGASTTDWQPKVLPSCSNATTSKLLYDTATNAFSCGTDQAGAGASPAWWGVAQWSIGDGNPSTWTSELFKNTVETVAGPTPTGITVSLARCVRFDVPASLTVNAARLWGVGATTNLYKFAIYPWGTSGTARSWESGTVTTTANAWLKITAGLPVTLAAGRYWWCVTAATTGTTAGFRSIAAHLNSGIFGAAVAPLAARAAGFGVPEYVQFAVTSGAFPATLPTVAAAAFAAGSAGTVPVALLDNSSTP